MAASRGAMNRVLTAALASSLGLAAAPALTVAAPNAPVGTAAAAEARPAVLVGEVTRVRDRLKRGRSIEVDAGRGHRRLAVDLTGARILDAGGGALSSRDLHPRQWVRAEGEFAADGRRLQARRVQVVAPSAFEFRRSGWQPGVQEAAASPTSEAPSPALSPSPAARVPDELALVGRVTDPAHSLPPTDKIQVEAAGNQWTVSVPGGAVVSDDRGRRLSPRSIRRGQWVRLGGRRAGDLRLHAATLRLIGSESRYRSGPDFRPDSPKGYVAIAEPSTGAPVLVEGTVVALDRSAGYAVVRDAEGKEHRVFLEQEALSRLQTGDPIRVRLPQPAR